VQLLYQLLLKYETKEVGKETGQVLVNRSWRALVINLDAFSDQHRDGRLVLTLPNTPISVQNRIEGGQGR
jgi:hypothetical protein